jgi:hypothetical protein
MAVFVLPPAVVRARCITIHNFAQSSGARIVDKIALRVSLRASLRHLHVNIATDILFFLPRLWVVGRQFAAQLAVFAITQRIACLHQLMNLARPFVDDGPP